MVKASDHGIKNYGYIRARHHLRLLGSTGQRRESIKVESEDDTSGWNHVDAHVMLNHLFYIRGDCGRLSVIFPALIYLINIFIFIWGF